MKTPAITRLFLAGIMIFAASAATTSMASPCQNKYRVPDFTNRRVQTIIHDRNRTIALERQREVQDSGSEDRVPTLTKVPFLSRLFKSRGEKREKRNLLVFVKPRIVDDPQ